MIQIELRRYKAKLHHAMHERQNSSENPYKYTAGEGWASMVPDTKPYKPKKQHAAATKPVFSVGNRQITQTGEPWKKTRGHE